MTLRARKFVTQCQRRKTTMSIWNLKDAVGKAIENENWYAALALGLTLPDICGKLEDNTATSQKRYIVWFDRYMSKDYVDYMIGSHKVTFMTGSDFYAIRCAFLHEGNDDISSQRAKETLNRFIFAATSSHKLRIDNLFLVLNVSEFCKEICEGVDAWYADIQADSEIQKRINSMMNIRLDTFTEGIYQIH